MSHLILSICVQAVSVPFLCVSSDGSTFSGGFFSGRKMSKMKIMSCEALCRSPCVSYTAHSGCVLVSVVEVLQDVVLAVSGCYSSLGVKVDCGG